MAFMGDFVGVLAFISIAALAAVWFFVPFSIFGTKARLDDLIDAVEEGNKHLADIKAILTRNDVPAPTAAKKEDDIEMPSIRVSR